MVTRSDVSRAIEKAFVEHLEGFRDQTVLVLGVKRTRVVFNLVYCHLFDIEEADDPLCENEPKGVGIPKSG